MIRWHFDEWKIAEPTVRSERGVIDDFSGIAASTIQVVRTNVEREELLSASFGPDRRIVYEKTSLQTPGLMFHFNYRTEIHSLRKLHLWVPFSHPEMPTHFHSR